MNNELEQQAIQSFATVPEIYQKAFQDAGADFPDELVTEIKNDPNQAVELLNSNKNLKSAVINIFKSNKDQILQYMQQAASMFKEGGKLDYLLKLQQGGNLTRKEALEAAQQNKGYNRAQARQAYQNVKYSLRSQGLRGSDLRDAARRAISGSNPVVEQTIERPQVIEKIETPTGEAVITTKETITEKPIRDYNNIDFGSFNFNNAFSKARNYGLKEFTWNGKKYTTNLALPALGPDGKNYSIVDTLLQEDNISSPDWWNAKQFELPTVLSGTGINPWPSIHAREIQPPLKRKEGGKLAKENEINKKYIKDSEKAGAKASKEMSDLKAKHKNDVAKLKKK